MKRPIGELLEAEAGPMIRSIRDRRGKAARKDELVIAARRLRDKVVGMVQWRQGGGHGAVEALVPRW